MSSEQAATANTSEIHAMARPATPRLRGPSLVLVGFCIYPLLTSDAACRFPDRRPRRCYGSVPDRATSGL